MSPRLMSTSFSSVRVTAIPANASVCSPSKVTIDFTRLVFLDGSTITSSPAFTMPEAIVPQ